MWDVENETPYTHAHAWDRDGNGAECWVVVVKGTFDILPDGSTRAAPKQLPVCEVPEYHSAPGQSSLRLDTDLVRVKPTTDILLLGQAHAPKGRPCEHVDVSLRTSSFHKTLRVHGNREWRRGALGWAPGPAQPFERMPLVYERACGGSVAGPEAGWLDGDPHNPVGVGHLCRAGRPVGDLAPNIEYPDTAARSAADGAPAGFGPIAPHWESRRRWAGRYDETWERRRKPLLPEDFDERFFLCAPADQRPPAHWVGGEELELTNMTPGGLLRVRLPRVVLGFETLFEGDEPVLHRQVLHTVIVEADAARLSLVWQTALSCHAKVLKLERTVVTEKRQPLGERAPGR